MYSPFISVSSAKSRQRIKATFYGALTSLPNPVTNAAYEARTSRRVVSPPDDGRHSLLLSRFFLLLTGA